MAGKIHESRAGKLAAWAALIASFGLSFATWVALAVLAGFDQAVTLWGVTFGVALLMPVAVDGYVVTALALWMADVPEAVAAFARKNTYAAAGAGVIAQSAYHCASTYAATHTTWRAWLALAVGALPPAVAAFSVHMRAKIRRHALLAAQAPAPVVSVTRSSDIQAPTFTTATPAAAVPPAAPAGSTTPSTATAQQARPAITDTDLAELEAVAREALAAEQERQRQEEIAWQQRRDAELAAERQREIDVAHELALAELADQAQREQRRQQRDTRTVAGQRSAKERGKELLRNGETVEDVMAALGAGQRTVYRWQQEIRAEREQQMAGARS